MSFSSNFFIFLKISFYCLNFKCGETYKLSNNGCTSCYTNVHIIMWTKWYSLITMICANWVPFHWIQNGDLRLLHKNKFYLWIIQISFLWCNPRNEILPFAFNFTFHVYISHQAIKFYIKNETRFIFLKRLFWINVIWTQTNIMTNKTLYCEFCHRL